MRSAAAGAIMEDHRRLLLLMLLPQALSLSLLLWLLALVNRLFSRCADEGRQRFGRPPAAAPPEPGHHAEDDEAVVDGDGGARPAAPLEAGACFS